MFVTCWPWEQTANSTAVQQAIERLVGGDSVPHRPCQEIPSDLGARHLSGRLEVTTRSRLFARPQGKHEGEVWAMGEPTLMAF